MDLSKAVHLKAYLRSLVIKRDLFPKRHDIHKRLG